MFCENMTMTLQCRLAVAGLAWLALPCPHRLRWSIPIVDAALRRSRWNEDRRRRIETSLAPQSPRNGAKVLLGRRSLALPPPQLHLCLSVCVYVCTGAKSEDRRNRKHRDFPRATRGQPDKTRRIFGGRPGRRNKVLSGEPSRSLGALSLSLSLSLPIDLWLWLLSTRRSRCSGFAIRSGVAARLVWGGERWDGAVQW